MIADYEGGRYLVSLLGDDVNWVRNLRASGHRAVPRHGRREAVRLLMGAEARALGRGGIRLLARAAGVREATVSLGVGELDSGAEPLGRARRPG